MADIIVFSTVPNEAEATRLAKLVVDERLAACANIVPGIKSIYQWKGKVREDNELLMIIKTTSECFAGIKDLWKEEHSYDVPELVAIEIKDGSPDYLKWLRESVRRKEVHRNLNTNSGGY